MFQAELLKFQSHLKAQASGAIKAVKETVESLVRGERDKKIAEWGKVKPPVFKQVMDLIKTSWGMQIAGSLKQALNVRKEKSIERAKQIVEIQNMSKSMASRFISKVWSLVYYLILFAIVFTFTVPFAGVSYVKE